MSDQQGLPTDQQPQPAPPAGMMRGEAKDDGGFDGARARAKAHAKAEDEAFNKKSDLQKTADARADQIIEGVDLDALAKEVDEDFSMASKFRNLRKLSPDATAKLAEIRQRVMERKKEQTTAKGAVDNDQKKDAIVPPVAGGASQTVVPDAAGQPTAAPVAAGAQDPVAGGKAADTTDEFTKKLDELRKEFATKLTVQQEATKKLEQENQKLKADKQKFEDEQRVAADQKRVEQFTTAAKAAGIPEDLADFAFGKAQDIVNKAGARLTYNQIFEKLQEQHPSIFKTKQVEPQAQNTPDDPKFRVQPGTGSNTGGVGSRPTQKPKMERGADSWDESRRKLKAQVRG